MYNKPDDVLYCGVDQKKIAESHPALNMERAAILENLLIERTNIYRKKNILQEKPPWTEDKTLDVYKFTNTRRELDKESIFLIESVIENDDLSYDDKILNCFLFRMINMKQPCLETIPEWPVRFSEIADWRKYSEFTVPEDYNGYWQSSAYFLSHCRIAAYKLAKALGIPGLMDNNLSLVYFVNCWKDVILKAAEADDPLKVFVAINEVPSIGDFMGYQIWVDWTYMKEYKFSENEFVVSGPGCDDGIVWLVEDFDKLNTAEFLWWLRDNLSTVMPNLNEQELFAHMPPDQRNVGLMQLENLFCEFNKYMKLTNEVKMRIRYYYKDPKFAEEVASGENND